MGARKYHIYNEMSCSTREINVVYPSFHVFFCLLYKGQSFQTKYIENQLQMVYLIKYFKVSMTRKFLLYNEKEYLKL